jgi:hypothetical protein
MCEVFDVTEPLIAQRVRLLFASSASAKLREHEALRTEWVFWVLPSAPTRELGSGGALDLICVLFQGILVLVRFSLLGHSGQSFTPPSPTSSAARVNVVKRDRDQIRSQDQCVATPMGTKAHSHWITTKAHSHVTSHSHNHPFTDTNRCPSRPLTYLQL